MADALDVPSTIATQSVATSILTPYLTGLTTQVLLIGVYLALFGRFIREDFGLHTTKVRVVGWVVLFLIVCCLGMAYEELVDTGISQQRTSEELFAGPAQSNVLPFLSGLVAAVCQSFLMFRSALLISSRPIRYGFVAVTTSVILLALAGASLFSGVGFLIVNGREGPVGYFTAEAMWLWSSAAADILVSIALAVTLHRRIAGFNQQTDSLLRRLIVVALQTAAYTSIISLAGAVIATAFEKDTAYQVATITQPFWLPLPPLHGISLYTTLSTRRTIAASLGAPGGVISLTPSANIPSLSAGMRENARPTIASRLASLRAGRSHGSTNQTGQGGQGSGFDTSSTGSAGVNVKGYRKTHGPLEVKVERESEVTYDDERNELDRAFVVETRGEKAV
ncbi:hypothetical protein NBRC10512_003825 [Rhodotorula toruloides]|uniref:RHTO0S02e05072g1_1 n=2 Tax=Rhodotorula toruloides TaxID=5286 RepID=A0A061AGF3_RHOTO|nr:uncharacterized protein RHTO_01147 [Rhodotorula toruloides NP11]EMS21932.1 hypothetical protein RHTO_01147 [Rhodotorula toruloides NP11]CDR36653.1 RHTO0S02e05072g1_1 [Rhodotorula toruloides]